MIWFWMPIIIGGIWCIFDLIKTWEVGYRTMSSVLAVLMMVTFTILGAGAYFFIGGLVGQALPTKEIILEEYPIYSMQESQFSLGEGDDNQYYYQKDSENGKVICSINPRSIVLKTTTDQPKFKKTGIIFVNDKLYWIGNDLLFSNTITIYVPQTVLIP